MDIFIHLNNIKIQTVTTDIFVRSLFVVAYVILIRPISTQKVQLIVTCALVESYW